jgi:hypothetical protein
MAIIQCTVLAFASFVCQDGRITVHNRFLAVQQRDLRDRVSSRDEQLKRAVFIHR